jgi:hypothetical protein|tara:strand:+ start:21 stop:308 length:288 start_codon:yes stop_codon:yes gene_type:complete
MAKVIPFFPTPPADYNRQYMDDIVRAFSLYVSSINTPGEGRNTFTVFTNLQTDDFNLETGAIFNHNGFVKISQLDSPHTRGVSGTSAVGSVTVTT